MEVVWIRSQPEHVSSISLSPPASPPSDARTESTKMEGTDIALLELIDLDRVGGEVVVCQREGGDGSSQHQLARSRWAPALPVLLQVG